MKKKLCAFTEVGTKYLNISQMNSSSQSALLILRSNQHTVSQEISQDLWLTGYNYLISFHPLQDWSATGKWRK